MTHLHGGFVGATSDGNPAVTPNGFAQGQTQSVFYTNQALRSPRAWTEACRRRCYGSTTTPWARPV